MLFFKTLTLSLVFSFAGFCFAQSKQKETESSAKIGNFDINQATAEARNQAPKDLTVLSDTISEEEIDRAVLNRLLQEIASNPATTKSRLGIDDSRLQEIFITISNARSFINGSEMANIRAMCNSWESSTFSGNARISEALAAYKSREQLTKNFIAKYYYIVLFDIESLLDESARYSFNNYMDDRRRRMANAGTPSQSLIVQNITTGAASIDFLCR